MRFSCVAAAAVGFVAAGCAGHSSTPAAPSEAAAAAAVERFAAGEYGQAVYEVSCDEARRDGSRACTATLTRTCDSYLVRFDRRHRLRVTHGDTTCYWVELSDSPPTRTE